VQLGVGFLEKIDPYLVGCTGGKLRLSERLARNQVIDGHTLPLPIFAQS
jgi:hypothetical protein